MRCYFHLVNSQEIIPDEEGVEILDLERAGEFALRAIEELREEAIQAGASWQGWRLDVVCPGRHSPPVHPAGANAALATTIRI
ncbi:hypothetical protein AAII07_19740 [Microvirga sp. 0TCS3.31]